ncbi:NAD-dependent epimerase/dehydratase family protein [Candidatus Wolfebacteria bacterium]|nr:NAD-dependent epimerase/dehydratase family protein [Candidatus Wolfebacteria bacterium]
MQPTLLITGGCGYVGSRIALKLSGEKINIVVADKATPNERGVSFHKDIEFRYGDLRERDKCAKALKGVDYVLHLAANIGPLTYMHEHQAEIMQENSAIDAAFYPAMIEQGKVKAIIYSSSSMVFQHASHYPYEERDLKEINPPSNIYGFSKLAGEYFCRSFKEQYGLPYVILRYHNIYGPGEDSKGSSPGDIHVIPALIEKVVKGQYPLKILGDSTATRPFTYIDDAVDATVRIVEETMNGNSKVINNDFNIGVATATRILDLAEIIWRLLGDGRPFKYEVEKTFAITAVRREMSSEKIEKILGWKPKIILEDGIQRTAEWIKNRRVNL